MPTASSLDLAGHYLEIGRPERALSALDDSGAEHEANARFWLLRAHALAQLERHDDALRAAREGLTVEPESVELLDVAADAAAELRDFEEAERLRLAALRLDPDDPQLLAGYAMLLARCRQLDKADRVLARAESVDPDDPAVMAARAAVAYFKGDDRSSRRHGERLLSEWDPDHPAGHAFAGLHHARRGSAGRAQRHFESAARYDVSDHELADVAREARIDAHWSLLPMRPITRFGPGPVWLVSIAVMGALFALGLQTAALVWALVYIAYVVYTWTIAPLARKLLERRLS
jgi:Flp pilus assembly protein TadD